MAMSSNQFANQFANQAAPIIYVRDENNENPEEKNKYRKLTIRK